MSEDVIESVLAELFGAMSHRKHYSRSTYKDGCRGPLCCKAERDKAARRRAQRNPGRPPRQQRPEMIELDECLDEIVKALGLMSEEQAATLAQAVA